MLLSPGKNGLTSLNKEVRVFKVGAAQNLMEMAKSLLIVVCMAYLSLAVRVRGLLPQKPFCYTPAARS